MPDTGAQLGFFRRLFKLKEKKSVMYQTGHQLSLYAESHSTGELLQRIIDEAELLTGSSIGFLHFVAPDQMNLSLQAWSTNTLHHMCTADGKDQHYPIDKAGIWVECFHTRKPVIHNDFNKISHRKGFPEGHATVTRELVVPVIRGDQVVAILGVGNKNVYYSAQDADELSRLADLTWEIVQRKQAEEKLAVREKWYEAIFDFSPGGVLIMDREGTIIDFNPAFSQSLGFSREELLGANFSILVPDYFSRNDKESTRELWDGYHLLHVVENVKKDGTPCWMEMNETKIYLPDGRDGILVVSNDITKRVIAEEELVKAKQQAEENNRQKSIFLGNMSHEIRTPMNVLIGFLSLLKDTTLSDEERTEYTDVCSRNGSRLLVTINDIIEISKIEIGSTGISYENIDLDAFLTEIHLKYYLEINDKSLYFKYIKPTEILKERPVILRTDTIKLYAILSRLISNAIKFTHEGGIEIGFYPKAGMIVIYVKDTGVGIPRERRESVFDQFVQVDNAVTRGYEGAGLGLSIARAYCEMLGGEISVESMIGRGSTFSFTLPYGNIPE